MTAPCADPGIFTRDHIESCKFDAPAVLGEQAVHCLELVAELAQAGLAFQFKGGNSLLMILENPSRFSIDVDIATDEPRERIVEVLDEIVQRHGVFARWESRQHKTKPWLPLASYYLYYESHFTDSGESSIMLDVQLRRSPYKTEKRTVVCGELYACDIPAEIPLPASIIGDKLLTLGPSTLGIPLGKGKAAQRLKHVYDVARLLRTGPRLEETRESFFGCLEQENAIQERKIDAKAVMQDTISYCGTVTGDKQEPAVGNGLSEALAENVEGLSAFAGHLFSRRYKWTDLQRDMASCAMCIAAVCTQSVDNDRFAAALADPVGRQAGDRCTDMQCDEETRAVWECTCAWLGRNLLVQER